MLAAAAFFGTAFASAPARTETAQQPLAARQGQARPTSGRVSFCAWYPSECSADPAEPEIVSLTPQVLATLTAINTHVNDTIAPVTDEEHWGVRDRWDYPDDGKGDCEDIQLLKRKLLAEQGLSRRAMRMTVVIDARGQGHAVLMVRTSRGDLILDNARDAVLPWQQTGYRFVKREGTEGPQWVWLDKQKGPAVTASR